MASLDVLLRDRGLLPVGVGIPVIETLAGLRARMFPLPQDGQQVRVYADPDPALNGYYVFASGDWGIDESFYRQVSDLADEAIAEAQAAADAANTAVEAAGAAIASWRGIATASISSSGHLILTYTDGFTQDVGLIGGSTNLRPAPAGAILNAQGDHVFNVTGGFVLRSYT